MKIITVVLLVEVLLGLCWYVLWPRNRWTVKQEKEAVRVCLTRYRWDGIATICSSPVRPVWMPE